MNETFESRISELEEKVANLERFKVDVEHFMRDAQFNDGLKRIQKMMMMERLHIG